MLALTEAPLLFLIWKRWSPILFSCLFYYSFRLNYPGEQKLDAQNVCSGRRILYIALPSETVMIAHHFLHLRKQIVSQTTSVPTLSGPDTKFFCTYCIQSYNGGHVYRNIYYIRLEIVWLILFPYFHTSYKLITNI